MTLSSTSKKNIRSDEALAQMIVRVAKAARAEVIICATATTAFAHQLHDLAGRCRVVVATPNGATYDSLTEAGLETIRLSLRSADKYRQARHVISIALKSTSVAVGDLVVCAIGGDLYPEEGNLIVLSDMEPGLEHFPVSQLLELTDGVRPKVLEAVLTVACKIGRAAQRGKRLGAIFMIGDSHCVLEDSKPLVPNPFHGHGRAERQLTNPDTHEALVELAKLDGAFVIRGDGFIRTAGVFLAAPDQAEIEVPAGLGARHTAAAGVTARTLAIAIVVSATDGHIRAFSQGQLALEVDPATPYDLINIEEE